MQAAPDAAVLQRARVDERVLVSADTDFGGLLSRSRATGPSVLLIRRLAGRRAAEQSASSWPTWTRSPRTWQPELSWSSATTGSGYAASQCLANPLRSATGRRCRIILRGIDQGGSAALRRGPASAPPLSLGRPARRPPGHAARSPPDQHLSLGTQSAPSERLVTWWCGVLPERHRPGLKVRVTQESAR